MPTELPPFYFRIRDNGAVVFRVDAENRQRRIEMQEIAVVNLRNGSVKPHGDHVLTEEEKAEIGRWMAARTAELKAREIDDILRTVDHLNLTTQWAQTKAEDDELEVVTERLLLAMHDLRGVLVRKKADRLMRAAGGGGATDGSGDD